MKSLSIYWFFLTVTIYFYSNTLERIVQSEIKYLAGCVQDISRDPPLKIVEKRITKVKNKTYNSRDSLVVTHPTTSLPIWGLCMAERTGCPILLSLWSYVTESHPFLSYIRQETSGDWHAVDFASFRSVFTSTQRTLVWSLRYEAVTHVTNPFQ